MPKAEAFLALLTPLQGPLEPYCRRLLRDREQVEDVLQSAVVAAFARFADFAPGTNFRAWIFRFVTLEALNRNRKCGPVGWGEFPIDVPAAANTEAEAVWADLMESPDAVLAHLDDTLAHALQELPVPERTVLLLRAVGEFSYREIHELLRIPLGSVIGYLSRARRKLRQALAGPAAHRPPGGPPP